MHSHYGSGHGLNRSLRERTQTLPDVTRRYPTRHRHYPPLPDGTRQAISVSPIPHSHYFRIYIYTHTCIYRHAPIINIRLHSFKGKDRFPKNPITAMRHRHSYRQYGYLKVIADASLTARPNRTKKRDISDKPLQ